FTYFSLPIRLLPRLDRLCRSRARSGAAPGAGVAWSSRPSAGRVRPLGQTGLLHFLQAEGPLLTVDEEADVAVGGSHHLAPESLAADPELHQQVVEALEVALGEEGTLGPRRLDVEPVGGVERVEPV